MLEVEQKKREEEVAEEAAEQAALARERQQEEDTASKWGKKSPEGFRIEGIAALMSKHVVIRISDHLV